MKFGRGSGRTKSGEGTREGTWLDGRRGRSHQQRRREHEPAREGVREGCVGLQRKFCIQSGTKRGRVWKVTED